MELLLAFAVGVETLCDPADGSLLSFGAGWEWKGLKARGLRIDQIVSDSVPPTCGSSPDSMYGARKHTHYIGVARANNHELMFRSGVG
jgi:hypothetical protein